MKIARYRPLNSEIERVGIVKNNSIRDLSLGYASLLTNKGNSHAYEEANILASPSLHRLIQTGSNAWEVIKATDDFIEKSNGEVKGPEGETVTYNLSAVKILPPLPSLSNKIISLARNFVEHALGATGSGLPKRPAAFLKLPTSVIGPEDPIIYPSITQQLDYEVEIAAIVSDKVKDIKSSEALGHIFGYSIFNDISARDQPDQVDSNFFFFGKNFDCSAPMGPWIVSPDEISNPHNLDMITRVNGETRQSGNSSNMARKFDEVFEYYSRDNTIYPGDIFTSGTPSGTGLEKKDGSWYLKPGDTLELEIENIGILRNSVVKK